MKFKTIGTTDTNVWKIFRFQFVQNNSNNVYSEVGIFKKSFQQNIALWSVSKNNFNLAVKTVFAG